jgi:hypothetical protein
LANDEKFEDFVVFDCVFGVPLFDETLNERICERIISNGLLEQSNMENISFATRNISESVSEFVQSHRDKGYEVGS